MIERVHIVALAAGALILAALAHVNIIATGGYGTPHSYLTMAVALGVACAGYFSGRVGGFVGISILDLLTSALGSMAANGLAAGVLIFGAHHQRTPWVEVITPLPVQPIDEPPIMPVIARSAPRKSAAARKSNGKDKVSDIIEQHAAKFAVECLTPGGEADLEAIRDQYHAWCPPDRRISAAKIGHALANLFRQAGIEIADRNGRLVAIGVSLKQSDGRELVPVEKA